MGLVGVRMLGDMASNNVKIAVNISNYMVN